MRVIKKYSNRRLYDTTASRYVNLEDLGALVRGGEDVQVLDASSGEDLTRPLLLQLLIESSGGADLFPVGLLHRIIRTHGDSPAQRAALQQLAMGLELLDGQVTRFERQFGWIRPDFVPHVFAQGPYEAYRVTPRAPPGAPPPEAGPGAGEVPDAPPPDPAAPPPDPPAGPSAKPGAKGTKTTPKQASSPTQPSAGAAEAGRPGPPPGPSPSAPPSAPPPDAHDELEALRERLASLEGRLRGGR